MPDFTDPAAIFRALREPFPIEDLEWRIGSKSKDGTRGMLLPFIDARAVMDRLDDVLGPENWQDTYEKVPGTKGWVGTLSVRINGEWIQKTDGADERDSVADRDGKVRMYIETKSGISDALKRCGAKLGIGRYLYYLDPIWGPVQGSKIDSAWIPELPAWALPGGSGFPTQARGAARAAPPEEVSPWADEPEPEGAGGEGVAAQGEVAASHGGWSGTLYWDADCANAHIRPAPLGPGGDKPAWFKEVHGLPGKNPLKGCTVPVKDMTWGDFAEGGVPGQRYGRLQWEIENVKLTNPKYRLDHEKLISRCMATLIWMEEFGPNRTPF